MLSCSTCMYRGDFVLQNLPLVIQWFQFHLWPPKGVFYADEDMTLHSALMGIDSQFSVLLHIFTFYDIGQTTEEVIDTLNVIGNEVNN